MDTTKGSQMLNRTTDTFRREIPETCYLSMVKKLLIEKLSDKFFLASHPFPKLEGEMIIFKPKKADQKKVKDVITYRDYSLRKRLETTPKSVISKGSTVLNSKDKKGAKVEEPVDKKEKDKGPEPKLASLEIDICDPLSKQEWGNFASVLDETQGMGWFQVLPVGKKSS